MAHASKINREKLLAILSEQQNQFDTDLYKIQQVKETERFKLIEQLQEAENNADLAIRQLLALTNQPLIQLMEQEKQDEERLLAAVNRYNENLQRDDIMAAMQDLLKQEALKFEQFDQCRIETSKVYCSDVLQSQDEHKAELINQLKLDSDLQKAAVGTLLERGDARSWGLVQQIRLVESQLATLTNIEIDKKKLQVDHHMNDLCEKRLNLSVLLIDLLDQQKMRRDQLISTLQIMEKSISDAADDFWLRQYQILLDKLPEGLSHAQKNIDPALAQALLVNGVIHCVPYLAKLTQNQCDTRYITDMDLLEAGVNCGNERRSILDAFHMYEKEKEIHKKYVDIAPSAPVPFLEEASAPLPDNIKAISTTECVICLDIECQIIFVPCGHLCCCCQCSTSLCECPLCRSLIEKKDHTHFISDIFPK